MGRMCMDCYTTYEDSLAIIEGENMKVTYYGSMQCPSRDCWGTVVEIDDSMIYPIRELNMKGYDTKFCCGGHIGDSCVDIYISFEDDIELPSLPEGFKKDKEGNVIRKQIMGLEIIPDGVVVREILKGLTALIEWVDGLEGLYGPIGSVHQE